MCSYIDIGSSLKSEDFAPPEHVTPVDYLRLFLSSRTFFNSHNKDRQQITVQMDLHNKDYAAVRYLQAPLDSINILHSSSNHRYQHKQAHHPATSQTEKTSQTMEKHSAQN